MCNLSSLKQFILLHWTQPANLNRQDLVSKDGCLRKDPTMFQRMDSSRTVRMTLILFCLFMCHSEGKTLQLCCLVMQGSWNPVFFEVSIVTLLRRVGFFAFLVIHRAKWGCQATKLKKPLWPVLFQIFSNLRFYNEERGTILPVF